MIPLDVALDRLLHRSSYRRKFLDNRTADLELSAPDIEALQSIDKAQLVETALAVRSSLLRRSHRGSGGIEQCWPQTLVAWRAQHEDEDLQVLAERFMESPAFEDYREIPHTGLGLCMEEALYRFFEASHTGDRVVREREFLAGMCKALALNPDPAFLVHAPLRRAPHGWFAVSSGGAPQLFAALEGRYLSGSLTPFLAQLLLSANSPHQTAAQFDVSDEVLAAAITRFQSLGILPLQS